MEMPYSFRCRTLTLFGALFAGTMATGGAEIEFKPRAEPAGSVVLLGDLAEIRGTPEEISGFGNIELFPSPGLNGTRFIRSVEVRQLLRLHGVDARGLRFSGAETIRVVSRGDAARRAPAAAKPVPPQLFVVYATRAIAPGERLRATDVELKPADRGAGNGPLARTLAEVEGLEATRALAAGQAIELRSLRRPILVQRGQAVTVVARIEGVRATTTARALEEGAQGDLILLESLESRQRYSAMVTGLQLAEVLATGVSVADPAPPKTTTGNAGKRPPSPVTR
jgi:flagella basal body P-ring formation protein FlgA